MRNRFEQQLSLGQHPIEKTVINIKSKNAIDELLLALKEIYCNKEYNERIFSLLENHITSNKQKTGRKGMDLWIIFVLSQVRLCLNVSYGVLHDLANNHLTLRCLIGVHAFQETEPIMFKYQTIYDNVSLLTDELIKDINNVVLEFGHREVFKKKEKTALHLKTDSFVVESDVHFPTDYNLLWDSGRKCMDVIYKFTDKYKNIDGWRKLNNWRYELKGLMREVGKASSSGGKGKHDRLKNATKRYLIKATALLKKLNGTLPDLPINDTRDLLLVLALEHFIVLVEKHIDLVDRRILHGEKIPHSEKLFSIFETYTNWINKGKTNPNVELGRKLNITTDQYNLIVDYQLMDEEQDRDLVLELAVRLIGKFIIASWSFDKGYWKKENKELLQLEVPKVIMPKLGRRNKQEEDEEKSKSFKKLKNKHCAIESNINELEHRGLDRCRDRGIINFTKYTGLAVCAYNLKKIGREIIKQKLKGEQKTREAA